MPSASSYLLAQIIRHVLPKAIVFNFDQIYTWFLQTRLTIPPPLLIQDVQLFPSSVYHTRGGTADVYLGQIEGTAVAVKVPRITQVNKVAVFQDCINEVMIMNSLGRHRHIIDIFGVSIDQRNETPCIVMPWMDHGNLADVIRLEPTAEYRSIMVEQIVDGMSFLRSSNVVHGDLKCSNVLVARDGRACIADFGLAHFSGAKPSFSSSNLSALRIAKATFSWILQENGPCFLDSKTCLGAGSPRWMAPERLWPERWGVLSATATFESDVFSLGMMIYEIYSGNIPFIVQKDHMAIVLIVQGIRPMRPARISDPLWHLAERCWTANPTARPHIEAINYEFNRQHGLGSHHPGYSKT